MTAGRRNRDTSRPFCLLCHHKAPHRAWEPDERNKARFKDRVIPEPPTLWDDYATRPAALPANEQTVAKDLTRRDLKLEPPAGLDPAMRAYFGLDTLAAQLTYGGEVVVRRVDLMESHLSSQGPRYETLTSFSLKGIEGR